MPTTDRPIKALAALAVLVVVAAGGTLTAPQTPAEPARIAAEPAAAQWPVLGPQEDTDEFRAPPTTTTTTSPPPPPVTTTTEAPQVPEPAPTAPAGVVEGDPYSDAAWDKLAQCESGGDWSANTGNGYYGGIQFSLGSWQGVGGVGNPSEASREEQITRGRLLWEQGGWAHWPACTRSFGWR